MSLAGFLPIFGITVRLRFSCTVKPGFYHQEQLGLFLQELARDNQLFADNSGIWLKAPESGITQYNTGDDYLFQLFSTSTAFTRLSSLLDKIRSLRFRKRKVIPSKSQFPQEMTQFIKFSCYFSNKSIKQYHELHPYKLSTLQNQSKRIKQETPVSLRFNSPARISAPWRGQGRHYIHDRFIEGDRLVKSLDKAFKQLAKFIGIKIIDDDTDITAKAMEIVQSRLFWTDNGDTNIDTLDTSFGGMLGELQITLKDKQTTVEIIQCLVLGQYLGIGKKRAYGLGSYTLRQSTNNISPYSRQPASSYRERCSRINMLEKACHNIARKHPYIWRYIDYSFEALEAEQDESLNDAENLASINLHRLSDKLKKGTYQASVLRGVILRKSGKHPRPLSIPPVEDRIAQRAVVEVMGPAIDSLSMEKSFGYRAGHSRQQARDYILMLNRQGYDWYFEADINEFFDLLSHEEIKNRLYSLFPQEPLLPLIMQWIQAPVIFDGIPIERPSGLPQGSPISPMLANLMLEDFDADLRAQGMKLVRFADDFVVLCKNKHQANEAARRAEQSLNELGLTLNQKKTHIGEFTDSFNFLGYTFLNGFAVEHERSNTSAKKLTVEQIPPASWLASLLQKKPQLLHRLNNTLDKKHSGNEPSPYTVTTAQQYQKKHVPSSNVGCTLFITSPVKSLHQKNGMLLIQDAKSRETLSQHNWNDLFAIVLLGRHNISQYCQTSAMNQGVPIHYCTASGKYQGVTTNTEPTHEGADLWLQQKQAYQQDQPQTLVLAKLLVEARIHNQTEVLKQRIRHDPGADKSQLKALKKLNQQAQLASTHNQLRGFEGKASALYFSQISKWIPEQFGFSTRQKRPSPDPFNALLSLGYTIIYSNAHSILKIIGLYPWKGFYHQGYGRHFALASDIMETFRHIVERTAMTMLRSGQLKEEHFYKLPEGACRMTSDALRIYLAQLNNRILTKVSAKKIDEPMTMQEHLLRTGTQLVQNIRDPETPVDFFKLK